MSYFLKFNAYSSYSIICEFVEEFVEVFGTIFEPTNGDTFKVTYSADSDTANYYQLIRTQLLLKHHTHS